MLSFTRREQIVILLLVIGIVAVAGYNIRGNDNMEILTSDVDNDNLSYVEIEENEMIFEEKKEDEDKEEFFDEKEDFIVIDICGQINNPGIVTLARNSRVIDAVEKAGGLLKDADRNRINLARRLLDEEKIYIPKIGEQLESINVINLTTSEKELEDEKININVANKEKLESLPGIGPSLAQRIIEYRKKKTFNNINEINNVSGIGEKKFEAIEELIKVE